MLEKPPRTGLPTDAAPVHEEGGEPEPGVVVQVAGGAKVVGEAIDADQRGFAGGDVVRHGVGVGGGGEACLVGFAVGPDALAELGVEALPVVAPGELVDELAGVRGRVDEIERVVADLGEGEDAMTEVGGESCDVAGEEVAAALVGARLDEREGFEGGVAAAAGGADRGVVAEVREHGAEGGCEVLPVGELLQIINGHRFNCSDGCGVGGSGY